MATGQMQKPKRVYYYRLQTLLIEGGTEVIRTVFDQQVNVPISVHLNTNRNTIIKLMTKHVLNKEQYKKLYPASGHPTSADFDITLLTCLLQHICGLKGSTDPVWATPPAPNDKSLEADIVRIRHLRNELGHKETVAMSEQDFSTKWTKLETILLRMNNLSRYPVPNLQTTIDQLKRGNVDEDMEKRYSELLSDWEEMDKAMTEEVDGIAQVLKEESSRSKAVQKEVSEMHEDIRGIQQKISPRLESLKAMSEQYFNEAENNKELFARTSVYKQACDKLNKTGTLILSGYPGEGKTTMAKYLLLETSPVQKILKLTVPQDWEHLNIKDWNAIFIDDIFGSEMLEEHTVKHWKKYMSDIDTAARTLKLHVVITTRDYILKGAKERFKLDLFKEENTTMLSSSDLSDEEKKRILKLHLDGKNRQTSLEMLEFCVTRWNNDECKVGFPECAVMFARDDGVFEKGPAFFARPFEFFRKCLSELLKHEENVFKVLILLWTRRSKTLSKFELEPKNLNLFKDIEAELDYPLQTKSRFLRESLERFKGGFLVKNADTEEYTFSHNFISDVVGLVAGEEFPDLVIKYGSRSFTMNYVKTMKNNSKNCLLVDKRRYSVLCKRLDQLLFKDKEMAWELDYILGIDWINIEGVENTCFAQPRPDLTVLTHEAFSNKSFVQNYIDPGNETDLVSSPVLEVFEHFRNPYCIVFKKGKMGMCLPTYLLATKNATMVEECIKRDLLSEKEKYIALLFATRDKNENLVRKLLEIGTTVNEDSLQIASVNRDVVILKVLLDNFTRNAGYEHIHKRSTPLITASKRGFVDIVECWLQTDVDVNYRNKDGLSALDKAVIGKHAAVCEALVAKGCELDVRSGNFKRTPLHKAADMGIVEIANLLVNAGASVDTKDHRGEYPVHSAALHGHHEIVELLLKKDKSLAEKTFSFRGKVYFKHCTLFHYAVWKEDKRLLKLLKDFEINPNIPDCYGRTPLYLAAFYNKAAFVAMLLGTADIKKPERNGYTPLHAAAFKINPEIVTLLCRSYTDIRMVDRKGNTVFHVLKKATENTQNYEGRIRIRDRVSNCLKILLEKDPEVQEVLKNTKNKKGETVSVEVNGNIYSLIIGKTSIVYS